MGGGKSTNKYADNFHHVQAGNSFSFYSTVHEIPIFCLHLLSSILVFPVNSDWKKNALSDYPQI